jgi:hypothetical protein
MQQLHRGLLRRVEEGHGDLLGRGGSLRVGLGEVILHEAHARQARRLVARRRARQKWERKEQWYKDNGYFDQLITSEDGLDGSIDATEIERIARRRILLSE